MKNYLLVLAIMYGGISGIKAQSEEKPLTIDSYRVELNEKKISNPGYYKLYEAYNQEKLTVFQKEIDPKNVEVLSEIPLRDKINTISIAEFLTMIKGEYDPYVFAWFPSVERKYFRLKDTNYIVVVPSQSDLKRKK